MPLLTWFLLPLLILLSSSLSSSSLSLLLPTQWWWGCQWRRQFVHRRAHPLYSPSYHRCTMAFALRALAMSAKVAATRSVAPAMALRGAYHPLFPPL
mgnify:CR=1 FL=1